MLFKVEVTRLWRIQDVDVRLRPPDQTSPQRGGNGNVSSAGRCLDLTFPLEVADVVTGLENRQLQEGRAHLHSARTAPETWAHRGAAREQRSQGSDHQEQPPGVGL